MDQSFEAEAPPKLFEFIEREHVGLTISSDAKGVLLAGEDLLRAAGRFAGSKRPKGWREYADGFGRRTEDRMYTLRVFKMDNYWYVARRRNRSVFSSEYLALAFGPESFCTTTDQEAMRLADHCYPDPGQTVGACWLRSFAR